MYYLLENIIHYYYCQSEGGEDSPPSPPLENTLLVTFDTSLQINVLHVWDNIGVYYLFEKGYNIIHDLEKEKESFSGY